MTLFPAPGRLTPHNPCATVPAMEFSLIRQDGRARAGVLSTPHGQVETPLFMPVGTQGTVKALTHRQALEDASVGMLLANTYHLFLRPGEDIIKQLGGLHRFINWPGPILTDSGGFQIFSLSPLRRITEEGAHFASHLDGSRHLLTPERATQIQNNLGADIIMALDECIPHPADYDYVQRSTEMTVRWAERCLAAHKREDQGLFGILQGGLHENLRRECAQALVGMKFPGYAIGGLSVGEEKAKMYHITEFSAGLLPTEKPRYLMGVGTPEDVLFGISVGIDMFDCVMPTRCGRNATCFTWHGRMNIQGARYANDDQPLDPECRCYTCRNFSRAYLRHLFVGREMTAATLATIHNLRFYMDFMKRAREAVLEGRFETFKAETEKTLRGSD